MEPAAAHAWAWTVDGVPLSLSYCVCTIGKLSVATGFWVWRREETYVGKLRSPVNITSWREFDPTGKIAEFRSRSFSSVRSSGSGVKQPP